MKKVFHDVNVMEKAIYLLVEVTISVNSFW